MFYKCDICNYSANSKSHYNKHVLTKKHIQKSNEVLNNPICYPMLSSSNNIGYHMDNNDDKIAEGTKLNDNINSTKSEPDIQNKEKNKNQCIKCNTVFAYRSGLSKHKKKCSIESTLDKNIECIKLKYETDLQIQKKDYEIKLRDLKIQMLEKHLENKTESEQFHQKIIDSTNKNMDGLIQTNMRTLTFLNKFYSNGPCLESFDVNFKDQYTFYINTKDPIMKYDGENFIISNKIVQKDDYIVDLIVKIYDLKTEVKYYINKIIEYYKNDKFPELQAMWSNDSVRNNYSVRIRITDNISGWHVDKSGLIATEKILDPLFEFTCNILKKGLAKFKKEMNELNGDMDEIMPIIRKMASISGFIEKVNKKELQPEIMRGLSSHFFFDVDKHKVLIEDKKIKEKNNYNKNNIITVEATKITKL